MSEMKNSGCYWLGEIPRNWETTRMKNLFFRKKEKAFQQNPIVLSLSREAVKIRDISSNEGQLAADYSEYNPVEIEDFLLNPMDLYSGANCNVSRVKGVISPAYMNLKGYKNTNPFFYDYLFKHMYISMTLFYHGIGISFDNRWTLNELTLMNIKVPLIPLSTQNKIVAYLDKQVAIIDQQIAKNKKAIELLNEYRASEIDKQMELGSNWKTEPLKLHFNFGKGLSITKEDLVEEGLPVISYGQIHAKYNLGTTITDELLRYVPDKFLENKSSLVNREDFIFADTSEDLEGIGNCIYIDRSGVLFAGYHTIILKAKSKSNKFFSYLFKSNSWRSQLRSMAYGTKVYSVTQSMLRRVKISIPPANEQKQIVAYLDKRCEQIDKAVAFRKLIIEKLEEYKKSLIYECVTGKKEVV